MWSASATIKTQNFSNFHWFYWCLQHLGNFDTILLKCFKRKNGCHIRVQRPRKPHTRISLIITLFLNFFWGLSKSTGLCSSTQKNTSPMFNFYLGPVSDQSDKIKRPRTLNIGKFVKVYSRWGVCAKTIKKKPVHSTHNFTISNVFFFRCSPVAALGANINFWMLLLRLIEFA